MLRLPPTAIGLGRSDLQDYDRRRIIARQYFAQHVIQNLANFNLDTSEDTDSAHDETALTDPEHSPSFQTSEFQIGYRSDQESDHRSDQSLVLGSSSGDEVYPAITDLPEDNKYHECVSLDTKETPENTSRDLPRSYSPLKDEFHYGGFSEIPPIGYVSNGSSPIAPDDVSTPNTRCCQKRRPTSGLTPRAAPGVANNHSPGLLLTQPPKRPPRRSPRSFRHQTNSFSFDSSKRASAAYEQDRISSTSTNNTTSCVVEEISLHDDLSGSSWQSSGGASEVSSLKALVQEDQDTGRDLSYSSQALALPPPFSTTSRSISRAGSLPTLMPALKSSRHLNLVPIGSPGRHEELLAMSDSETNPALVQISQAIEVIDQAHQGHDSQAELSSPHTPSDIHTIRIPNPQGPDSQTSARSYQVYNDALSPERQPQTPANLPEARHQSRYHPSVTVPTPRAHRRRGLARIMDSVGTYGHSAARQFARDIPYSPAGLPHGGFQGLYGGRENGDEEQNWVEGVRFNNAEVRLWGSRDANNEGRSLRETPEPDDWRVGRRN